MGVIPLGPYSDDPGFPVAQQFDKNDPLAEYRDKFVNDDETLIYLDGNSLGRLPKAAVARLHEVVAKEWGQDLVHSWPTRWWDLATEVGRSIAPIVGADPSDLVVADSTSIALFKLTLGALQAAPNRTKVVTDNLNFPSDLYVTQSAAAIAGGRRVEIVDVGEVGNAIEEALIAALDHDTALLTLSHVAFKSGYLYDMERLTAAAHAVGAMVLWDLSHSVGAVPVDLAACAVDLAVGCTYKYLNGGPGAPAFLYVSPDSDIVNPIAGWWAHRDPFSFSTDFESVPSINRFQTGTMPILSLSAVGVGIGVTAEAGMAAIRDKSIRLSEFFIELADRLLTSKGYSLASPRNADRRGSHVSLRHSDGWRITQALIEDAKVIPDFRDPDNIRFGFAPLYTRFVDVHSTVMRMTQLHETDAMSAYSAVRTSVS